MSTTLQPGQRRSRLSAKRDCAPWVQAESVSAGALLWLPVSGFPLMHEQREWLLRFLQHFAEALRTGHGLGCEAFLRLEAFTPENARPLRTYAGQNRALIGMSRSADTDFSPLLSEDQNQDRLPESFTAEASTANLNRTVLWFLNRRFDEQLDLFLGNGGVTLAYMPSDPKTQPPPLPITPALRAAHPAFQQHDVDGMIRESYAERAEFLDKSRIYLGTDMFDTAEWKEARFILPQFNSAQFFRAGDALRKRWFRLAPVYLLESPEDKGILLALKEESLYSAVEDSLDRIRHSGLSYNSRIGAL